jgi:hypothetical protein
MEKKLEFQQSKKETDIVDTYNYNVEVFADAGGFGWTLDGIKDEIKKGWKLYSAKFDDKIVAAIFMKEEKGSLLTKNTPIKLEYQGNGFSHQIKDYYESIAKDKKN